MGVPKFFRYTSERYPCLNELVKQHQIPDFDNMYLDMNGIIHNCSHPDDSNPHFRITEEKIFSDIFHYIEILFQIIKPKKLFFMAIDGVAPRAKMNQQRGRRFRSAREAEKLEEQAKAKGEVLPTEKRFDSNCITPGTVFMVRLHEQLRYFVKSKISTDPLWAKAKIVLSGHETPGEGEHKIMDYIRWSRSQPDYDPNTRHCLYGLDADLIMLGMCTHEPHFALLREEVKFGRTTQRATTPEETNFYLLHLSLLREYLEQEFIVIKDKLPFKYDIENIVDDWVLMGFLVGNDFIPNLPNMHINNDALPLLYKTYMTVLPTLDGYINEAGDLHLGRFETFMQELAKIDKVNFEDTYLDLKFLEGKTGRKMDERREYKPNNDETFNVNIDDIKTNKPDDDLQALINATDDMLLDDIDLDAYDDIDISEDEANFNMEFQTHKNDYYMNKLDYTTVTDEVLAYQAEGYVRAIQWNLFYYYKGCPSWCWYYPHHYAPFISDIKGFKDLKIEFELGEPFKPFEQLLAVLPAASKNLLPPAYHSLMTDENSPIYHYYPVDFETDLNGKRNDWEAVVLIPFIDEGNLLAAMMTCQQLLTDEERKRNTHGPMLMYDWSPQSQGEAKAPDYFPPITECHAVEQKIWRQQLFVPEEKLIRGMLPTVIRDLVFPGFPTMRHLKYKTYVKKCKVKVFDQQSMNENMIVKLKPEIDLDPPIEQVARDYLGKVVWVGWPHLTRAKVVSVSNEKVRLHLLDRAAEQTVPEYSTETNAGNLHKQWISERSTIIDHNMYRLGVQLGDVYVIIHAVTLKGYKYIIDKGVQLTLEPEWCTVPCGYALQAIVTDVNTHVVHTLTRYSTVQEAFPPGDHVFLTTPGPYYGSHAKIVESERVVTDGRVKVCVHECREPVPPNTEPEPYKTAQHAAANCGITPQMLSRITGSVFVVLGERNNRPTENLKKVNVGLNLKFNKKNQEVSGFTRRNFSNAWLYSERCVELVSAYSAQYPELFDNLARSLGNDIFFESDLWPSKVGEGKAEEVNQWLSKQPHFKAVRRICGSEALEPEELKQLADSIDKQFQTLKHQQKKVTLQVKVNLLYKSELHEGNISPDPKADFQLYDRVICVAKYITVPIGSKGTITAVYKPEATNTVRMSDKMNMEASYQVLFDDTFPGAITEELFTTPRFYRMLPCHMLNLSYGRKLRSLVSSNPSHQTNSVSSTLSNTPNVLRKEDGHNSAFASYSPTKERQTPSNDARANVPAPPQPVTPQEDSTNILKNLLKISLSDDKSPSPSAKNQNPPEVAKNWRRRDPEPQTTTQQMPLRSQPANWRKEGLHQQPPAFNNRAPPPSFGEWQNKNYNQMSQPLPQMPPFPSFNQPFNQGPRANQVPFPQFQSQPYQQNRNFNQQPYQSQEPGGYNRNQDGGYNRNFGQNGAFPKNLPSVGGNFSSPPSNWMKAGPINQPPEGVGMSRNPLPPQERVNNPFVPLQVQASQRRVQNPGGAPINYNRKNVNSNNNPVSKPVPQAPQQLITQQISSEPKQSSNKPQRKKKSRIAASLPFQMD